MARRLRAEDLRAISDPAALPFATTAELTPLDRLIGQDRALGERFQIHAVSTVDEGLALLSGRPAGERSADGRFPPDSFNGAVELALAAHVRRLRELRAAPGSCAAPTGGSP